MRRADTLEQLSPLVELCRAGKLFEVQKWIRQGGPIALPLERTGAAAKRNPLRIAFDKGFHSLAQVLLEAGAPIEEGTYNAMDHAVDLRRPDLVELLIENGVEVSDYSMRSVIDLWHPRVVELFLDHGASLTRDNPIARGLVYKIRPTLGLLKRSVEAKPSLLKQAEVALRFHASQGNAKWVSLLIWAGADPWARGPGRLEDLEDDPAEDEEEQSNAVEHAIFAGKVEVLKLKKMLCGPDPERPETLRLLEEACHAPNAEVLSLLLERGHTPELLPDRGTASIESLLYSMSWDISFSATDGLVKTKSGIDNDRARERMKILHVLVARGAKWLPKDKEEVANVRKNLVKMARDYVLEFVWLMKSYSAARRADVKELLRTPTMVQVLGPEREQASRIVEDIPEHMNERSFSTT